jgi:tripartite-type tricarboxylate transporter receptor subunit TctC
MSGSLSVSWECARNFPLSFRDAAKRRARNPVQEEVPAQLDSGLAPSARPGMTARWGLAVIVLTLVFALLNPATASAQQSDPAAGWPKQPVRMVVGLAPGGANDIMARIVAQKLTERLGQPVIVENRAGAGGAIAADFVARSAPDGYTLFVAPSGSMVINPSVYSKLPYDPLTSYEPVANMVIYHLVLSVSSSQPIKSVAELVAWGKANPDKANYASTSAVFQLTTELFNQKTGSKFQHIPFKSGAELVSAVLTGQTVMTFADAASAMPQLKAGGLRPLASTGAKRLPELPDVPTLAEAGIDGVVVEGFIGLMAPKGTPAAIVKKLETEVTAIVRLPDVQARIKDLGLIADPSSGAAFRERIAVDIPKYTAVAKAAGIKFD